MKFMKIVAINDNNVFVQTSDYKNRDYTQTVMNNKEFVEFMKEHFTKYYEEFAASHNDNEAPEYFYHYGETFEMRIKGIAYIYTK